jgi:hypothetical protein
VGLYSSKRGGPYLPPFGPDGIERRIWRPQDPTAQTRCDRGKKTCHTLKNVLLIKAALTILFLSETYAGIIISAHLPLEELERRLSRLFSAYTIDGIRG